MNLQKTRKKLKLQMAVQRLPAGQVDAEARLEGIRK